MNMRSAALWLTIVGLALAGMAALGEDPVKDPEALQKLYQDGNFREAYQGFRALALDPQADPRQVGHYLNMAHACLQRLGDLEEVDEFREQVIGIHGGNWRLLQAAAESYLTIEHWGFRVAGKFHRGGKRGGGEVVNAVERDRVRALQLLVQAMPLARQDDAHAEVAQLFFTLARALLNNAGYGEAWRLQALTDLAELPDYEPGWYYGRGGTAAPVNEDGTPVYYTVPESFEAAKNDGERWRWALAQAVEFDAGQLNAVRWELAQFCQSQFGEQTLADYGWWFGRPFEEGKQDESGTYALHTLSDDETIARLATGIKRFTLPDEFNYLKIFKQIAAEPRTGLADQARDAIARVYENRRQYPKAAEAWRQAIAEHGPGVNNYRQQALEQITGNWGRFESIAPQPAGEGASVEFRFRNGKQVHFEARRVRVDKLLEDVKAYLKSNPAQLDWQQFNIGDLGYRLVVQNQQQYLEEGLAASWNLDLEPREAHFDKRITVTTPLQKAGAYLLTAQMAGGNRSQIILWVADTVIVKKPLDGQTWIYVADAVTGQPIQRANVEFFGFRQRHIPNTNRFVVDTRNFAEFTSPDGQAIVPIDRTGQEMQWIIIARTQRGRLAYLGFTGIWGATRYDAEYNAVKVFTITDRPVYRPGQAVKFKFWVRRAQYDQEDTSDFAGKQFTVEVMDPKGDKILERTFEADAYGGMEGELNLARDATLGVYQLYVKDHGGGTFRVEEYKKPEFEVTIEAPTQPVMLGEPITARIQARYYFGAPVTQAKVHYKITRTSYDQRWFPVAEWDWFYGRGYWWFAYEAKWYPGFARWGCLRPLPFWYPVRFQPPELVADAEVPIGPDGTLPVQIDTSLAKLLHPDQDHEYQITAEVVDESRRTIVGQGTVRVARQPFKVFAWVDRGHYRVGDVVQASFQAHTLNEQPVKGRGKLRLLRISYDKERKPVERKVQEWDLDTDEQGRAAQKFKASSAGQFRLSYQLTDAQGHTQEGGYLFTVMGRGFDGKNYRFNELELIPDQREYKAGDTVRLQVNTDRPGSTVALFVRPANGVYLPPQIVRVEGQSTVIEIGVAKKDMPNFFVEALTVADGKSYGELRELVVPPEERVLRMVLEPSQQEYLPGQEAKVKLTLTDLAGKPFVGTTVLAIYDKAVEYVSGGSNVPDIREFFWKWRRTHYPQSESNLDVMSYNIVRPGDPAMGDLGIFGATVADELEEADRKEVATAEAKGARRQAALQGRGNAAPGAPLAENAMADGVAFGADQGGAGAPAPELVQPTVRTQFADTALWAGSLTTDGDGTALVSLVMPENLTTWRVRGWGLGHGTKVGEASVEIITRKNVIVRLQAPRFFVEKDEVVLSANVHNYLPTAKQAQVSLELDGPTLAPLQEMVQTVNIEAGGEVRVDWRVRVVREGEAIVRMRALTDEESDAMQMSFPVYVHGMLKQEALAGALRPEHERQQFEIRVPQERRPEQTRFEIRYSPTIAGAMVDALPYLASYPYGCTEQTLNRFLPTVIVQRILLSMNLDLRAIREKRVNLNPQELGDAAARAQGWKRYEHNPVFDEEELRRMVKDGVQRLTEMQLNDGGWGWFSGWGERSWPHTTAYVVHGLQLAAANDVALVPGVLERGVAWLADYQQKQVALLKNAETMTKPYKVQADNLDAFVYMVLVDAGIDSEAMQGYLYRDRTKLAVYSQAMLGLALHKLGVQDRLAMVLRNIRQFLKQDDENQTAWLDLPEDNYWWFWYGSDVEANAYYLKLLSRTDPRSEAASRLVKYLLNNRKHATYWNSTRDTAVAIEALAEYWRASGETQPDLTVEIWVDGQKFHEAAVNVDNLFTFDNSLLLQGDALAAGPHQIEIRKRGSGPLYWNAYLTNFTLEDHISRAGLEIKVQRAYYKLVPEEGQALVPGSRGQAIGQRVEKYRRVPLDNLAELTSGDLVEIELEIDSKNDYEYLIFEDMKAAGFEPVDLRSGYTGNALGAYMELRDERVTFFVRWLARGKHSVSYRLRAEIPGRFSALPTRASAMYAPELRANSDEIKLVIVD